MSRRACSAHLHLGAGRWKRPSQEIRMIRSLILSATLLAALAAAGCGGGGSKNGGPTQPATVAALLSQFEAAYQAKDAAGVAAMCAYPFVMDGVSISSADTLQEYL